MADTAQCYMSFEALGKCSANIVGRSTAVSPLRMQLLANSFKQMTYLLTWDVLATINKTWGECDTISYTDVNSTYVWNPTTGVFTITNSAGTVTTLTNKYTIEALEVSCDVISQLYVVLNILDATSTNVFLIASQETSVLTPTFESITWGTSEYLAEGTQHAVFSRISEFDNKDSSFILNVIGEIQDCNPLLLEAGGRWAATNNYPLDLLSQDTSLLADRSEQSRTGAVNEMDNFLMIAAFAANLLSGDSAITYEPTMLKEWLYSLPSSSRTEQSRSGFYKNMDYLMIALFAQNLLSSDSNICYEPWMLYGIFQWYFVSSGIVANTRRIFDLSPRWS